MKAQAYGPWLVVVTGCALLAACTTGGGAQPQNELPQGGEPFQLDAADFSTTIDNELWPMEPGTQWVFRETGEGDPSRVVVTVSSVTKEIANGITARVVRDTVSRGDEIVEDTFDYYAQHSDGTIWYLGEDTAEFEGGAVASTEGSFEAGVDGALAGVIVPGDPEVGLAYRQEYLKGQAEDNGKVLSVDEQAEVPAGHYEHTMLTTDTATTEPDVLELKFYAPGVGPVLTLGASGGSGREELLEMTTVSSEVARAAGETPLGEPYE